MSDWIYCKDRMPDKDGRYIVCNKSSWVHVEICSLRKGKWDAYNVYAWMPIPNAAEFIEGTDE